MKPANKAEQSAAESVERRAGTKGNADQQSTYRTQSRANVSQALERIRKVASDRFAVTQEPALCITVNWAARLPTWGQSRRTRTFVRSWHVRYASTSDPNRCIATKRRDVPRGDLSRCSNVCGATTATRSPRRRAVRVPQEFSGQALWRSRG
jgi:hypothetical protein